MTDFDIYTDESLLLLIDIQERFGAAIPSIVADEPVANKIAMLAQGCNLLQISTVISEQVPDKLGPTMSYVQAAAARAERLSKSHFSCLDDSTMRDRIASIDKNHVIVAGIEAHVCVLTTVDDLIKRGYRVTVASDAIASRHPENCDAAVVTMRQLGALVVPVESILFRLQRQAGIGVFKELSRLVR